MCLSNDIEDYQGKVVISVVIEPLNSFQTQSFRLLTTEQLKNEFLVYITNKFGINSKLNLRYEKKQKSTSSRS